MVDALDKTSNQAIVITEWEPPPPLSDLIFDDGEPLESNHHPIAMNVLIRSILQAFEGRSDYFTGGKRRGDVNYLLLITYYLLLIT